MNRKKKNLRRSQAVRAPYASPKTIDRAKRLAQEAQAAYDAGEAHTALKKIRQAMNLVSHEKGASITNGYFLMALCYQRLGQTKKAIQAAERELTLNPTDQKANELLTFLKSPGSQARKIELKLDTQSPPILWPSVSLCMIVKNEEKYLADCLESVGNLASEIIIVDTGSTDRTVEIAESFGAHVKHFTWINDFAAARNESIKNAAGEWIFWMDADDRISPDNLIRLKKALVSEQADAYFCQVISQVKGQGQAMTETVHLRLFRNGIGLQFEGPIHEDITPSAMRQGSTIAQTNIIIEHTGYATNAQILKDKARRNLAIIKHALAQEPQNLYWRHHLGVCLYSLDDFAGATEQFEAVIADPPSVLQRDREIYQAHASLVAAYNNIGQPDEAEAALERALSIYPERRHLRIAGGIFYLAQGEAERAIEFLERAKNLAPESDSKGLAFAVGALEMRLSQAYLLSGELWHAKKFYLDYLDQIGQPIGRLPNHIHQEAQHLFDERQDKEIIQLLQVGAQADPAALRLLAQVYARNQRWQEALRALENAIILSHAESGELVNLADYAFKSGNTRVAERYCRLALTQNERDTAAHNLLGIIAFKQNDLQKAIEQFITAILINSDFEPACSNLSQVAQAVKTHPAALIRQYGQQLMAQNNYVGAAEVFSTTVKLYPHDVEGHQLLAVALHKLGHEEEALYCWQTAESLAAA